MKMPRRIAAAILFAIALPQNTATAKSPITHVHPKISKALFSPNPKLITIAQNLRYAEGPLWITPPNPYLIFSDVPANTIYKYLPHSKKLTIYKKPSHHANGNTLDNQNNLITCNHSNHRIISTNLKTKKITTLTSTYQNKRLNSPNDVIVKADGTIFFTDPSYGLKNQKSKQTGNHLYKYNPQTKITTILDNKLFYPNGLCLSPDQKTLYLTDRPNIIYAYKINKDNTLSNRKIFAKLPLNAQAPDGIRADTNANLWIATSQGVIVLSKNATHLATIHTPPRASNLAFGGKNNQTLFITAVKNVYQIQTRATGNKTTQTNLTIGQKLKAHRYTNLYITPQPTLKDFTALKKQGFTTVINLRSPNEYNEKAQRIALKKLGINYYNIPFKKLSTNYINRIADTIANQKIPGKILIHCKSGNRAAIWLGGHLQQNLNQNSTQAIKNAKKLGLTKPKAIQILKKYLSTKK